MPIVHSDEYLQKLLNDAEFDAVNKVDYLFYRYSIPTTAGVSVYTLPSFVRRIQRITWRGKKVDPITWQELAELSPNTIVGGGVTVEGSTGGTPKFYALHPNDLRQIRFFPTPGETIAVDDSGIMGPTISSTVIITCWRTPILENDDWTLPAYLKRRTTKAYAMYRALAREGKGQDIVGSEYYKGKLEWLYSMFSKINSGIFVSKRPRLGHEHLFPGRTPGRPQLPYNFGVRDPWA